MAIEIDYDAIRQRYEDAKSSGHPDYIRESWHDIPALLDEIEAQCDGSLLDLLHGWETL